MLSPVFAGANTEFQRSLAAISDFILKLDSSSILLWVVLEMEPARNGKAIMLESVVERLAPSLTNLFAAARHLSFLSRRYRDRDARSAITMDVEQSRSSEAGMHSLMGPLKRLASTSALPMPLTIRMIDRACFNVPRPSVSACFGTSSSFPQYAALEIMDSAASGTMRVRLAKDEPGSLKPRCPFGPSPSTARSKPPRASMAFSMRG